MSVMFVKLILNFLFSVLMNDVSYVKTETEILLRTETFGYSLISDQDLHIDRIEDFLNDVETEVTFYLFTNANKEDGYLLKIGDLESLLESPFDPEYSTKVIIHGWTDSVETYWYNNYRQNYLATGNYNVILVDWSSGARKEYFTSAKLTRPVGEHVGKLLAFLQENGNASLSNFHILGHSLGAHIAGITGSSLLGQVGRITGMDPASPGFELPSLIDSKYRLDHTDAIFVDVIHTCSGTLGFKLPIGHADFFPNGGTFSQPGCVPLMSQFCSHARSHQYMSESIVHPEGFISIRCDSWRNFVIERCGPDMNTAFMGEIVDQKNTRGNYYLRTNPQQPFGRGVL